MNRREIAAQVLLIIAVLLMAVPPAARIVAHLMGVSP